MDVAFLQNVFLVVYHFLLTNENDKQPKFWRRELREGLWVLVQDPYERKMVAVIRSRVQGGGEGLVARRHLTQGTVIGRGHPAAVRMGQGTWGQKPARARVI